MGTKIKAMKVNGRWWNMPLPYIGRKAVVEYVSIILRFRVCHIHVQKGWQIIYILCFLTIWEISVYLCLVSDRLPNLKLKEVSVTGVYRVLVGKPEGKRPLVRPRCRREDNIKMDLQEVGGGHGDWMELAQDRDRWVRWGTLGFHKCGEFLD